MTRGAFLRPTAGTVLTVAAFDFGRALIILANEGPPIASWSPAGGARPDVAPGNEEAGSARAARGH
jgi:hypothetical protein